MVTARAGVSPINLISGPTMLNVTTDPSRAPPPQLLGELRRYPAQPSRMVGEVIPLGRAQIFSIASLSVSQLCQPAFLAKNEKSQQRTLITKTHTSIKSRYSQSVRAAIYPTHSVSCPNMIKIVPASNIHPPPPSCGSHAQSINLFRTIMPRTFSLGGEGLLCPSRVKNR